MDMWTVRALLSILNVVSFKASNHSLVRKVNGKRHRLYRLGICLLPHTRVGHLKDSVWNPFLEKGYIKEFHESMYELIDKDSSSLILSFAENLWEITMFP